MDTIPSMPPSVETVAAGVAGFALASLLSFARKPQVEKQDAPATSKTPAIHFPGMGHDFHVLARLVGEKQQSLDLLTSRNGAEQNLLHMLRAFGPQLAEFSSFEWRANLTRQNYPGGSEIVGRNTHVVFVTGNPSQGVHSASHSSMVPGLAGWSETSQTNCELATAERKANKMRSIENTPEETPDRQHNQRRRKCRGRDEETRTSRRGWRRSRDEDTTTSPTNWGWTAPREDYRDGWGWSRYHEE